MDGHDKKSKKPSVTNSRLPEEVTFFIDASLGGKTLGEALRAAGARVELHDNHFPQGTPDVVWLTEAGTRNWVVFTKDERIRYNQLERQALLNAGVRAFVLTARGLRGAEYAQVFVEALPAIHRLLNRQPGPFIAKVTRGADVVLLLPEHKKPRHKKTTKRDS
jgi:hypothetical protein